MRKLIKELLQYSLLYKGKGKKSKGKKRKNLYAEYEHTRVCEECFDKFKVPEYEEGKVYSSLCEPCILKLKQASALPQQASASSSQPASSSQQPVASSSQPAPLPQQPVASSSKQPASQQPASLSLLEALKDALKKAHENVINKKPFMGVSKIDVACDMNEVNDVFKSKTNCKWITYGGKDVNVNLSSCDDKILFVQLFEKVYKYTVVNEGRKTQNSQISSSVFQTDYSYFASNFLKSILPDVDSVYHKLYVLRKPKNSNMTWHVDKNTGGRTTDLVIYFIIGPPQSYSVFYTFYASTNEQREKLQQIDSKKIHIQKNFKELTLDKVEQEVKKGWHKLDGPDAIPYEIKNELNNIDGIEIFCLYATAGQVVVFDGSKLHGVSNNINFTNSPQVVLALNINYFTKTPKL